MSEHHTDDLPVRLAGPDNFKQSFAELLSDNRLSLDIYSPELNRELLGSEQVADSIAKWVSIQPRARVRVFVQHAQTAMYRGNPLIELGLKLSSYFEFREPAKSLPVMSDMAIIDGKMLIQAFKDEMYRFLLWPGMCSEVAEANKRFSQYWQEGQASQQIRGLHL